MMDKSTDAGQETTRFMLKSNICQRPKDGIVAVGTTQMRDQQHPPSPKASTQSDHLDVGKEEAVLKAIYDGRHSLSTCFYDLLLRAEAWTTQESDRLEVI